MSEKLVDLWIEKFGAKPVVSVQEAAELANVHENTIRKAIDDRLLSSFRMGSKLLRISLNDLASWMGGSEDTPTEFDPKGPPVRTETFEVHGNYFPYEGRWELGSLAALRLAVNESRYPCILHLKLTMRPLVVSSENRTVAYINEFAAIQSALATGYIDIQNEEGKSVGPPINVARCYPRQKTCSEAPEMRLPQDAIFLQADYSNNSNGCELADGGAVLPAGNIEAIHLMVGPVTPVFLDEAVQLNLDQLPIKLEVTIGYYGF